MIDGREIRSQRHVIDIRIGFGRTQWRIDQLAIISRQRNGPIGELCLQVAELPLGEQVAEAARAAMGEECDVSIAQAEYFSGTPRFVTRFNSHNLRLAEMIATPI